MNPEELRKLIAEEIGKAVKAEVKPFEAKITEEIGKAVKAEVAEALKPFEAKITEEIGKAVKVEVAEALKPTENQYAELKNDVKELNGKVEDVRNEQTRLNAMFEMHIAHTAERKADAEKVAAQQKDDTAERWKIAAIVSAIGFSVISLLNQIFGWFGKHGN